VDRGLAAPPTRRLGRRSPDIADSQRPLVFGIVSAVAANTAVVLTASRRFD